MMIIITKIIRIINNSNCINSNNYYNTSYSNTKNRNYSKNNI